MTSLKENRQLLLDSDEWWRGKVIPKRKDYFRHYQEMADGFQALRNIFETPAGIAPGLAGVSEFTKPKTKFLSIAQQRLGMASKRDAVGGFLNYIPAAAYAKHIDPHIVEFRKLATELASATKDSKNVNNFIEYLHDFTNDLAGKTNPADRYLQKVIPGGRKTFKVINWLNTRVKANTILGNASSSIAQLFNIPQGIASAKQYSVPGATRTLGSIFQKSDAMQKSLFLKERYAGDIASKFDTGLLANTKKFAVWMTGVLDEVGTKFIWNSHYEKALAQKIEDPIKYADDITKKLVGGRGVGEAPLLQKSKVFQVVAPFQLEVGNLWYVMRDQVRAKDFGGIATLFAALYLMNRAAEQIRGSDVAFDPIKAVMDGVEIIKEDDNKAVGVARAGGRLAGEVLSNIPLGQTVAGLYPEKGAFGLGTRSQFFGEGDPFRYGGGLVVSKGIRDPYKILPPFGGSQIKKAVEGAKAYIKGETETATGKTTAKIEKTPMNLVKSVLFGKYASREALNASKESADLRRRVDNQTQARLNLSDEAEQKYEELKKKGGTAANEELKKIYDTNRPLYNKIVEVNKDEQLGLDQVDRYIKMLGVENGERARYLYDQTKRLKTNEEKNAFLKEMYDKKLLSKEVNNQIAELAKKR